MVFIVLGGKSDAKKMKFFLSIFFILAIGYANAQQTEVHYLSGKGNDDMVQWDFFCTDGMNANKWTKIGVPSCWELQGFGKYNYGFDKDSIKGKEQGLYKYHFDVPTYWKGKSLNIVFEGVMTDAAVKINGISAGTTHKGAFYAFKYDITGLLKYGKNNLLEVTVSKHSANKSVNAAEREGDYWIFGGVFRPVWLEVLPKTHLSDIQIDANADGTFRTVFRSENIDRVQIKLYDNTNSLVEVSNTKFALSPMTQKYSVSTVLKNPKLWNPESPHLYRADYTIYRHGTALHTVSQKFGFRTIELRLRDGIYVNGVKMKFKGINRHSFRPETGRAMSKQNSIEDVLLMKEMNMNAVRMSHYPPDGHFLDVCDSLGLFVMDELAGWHGHYDTPTGTVLLKEMIDHDMNHPSVVFWSNGNEGGHNTDLDSLFSVFDIQKRPVVHPWQLYNGIETQHYRQYNYGIGNYDNGRNIVMPTEFLHGQFDGGHGAGLEDYWDKMWHDPLHAGGFLWDFADQAVVRKDLHDSLDTDKSHAADGIVGPHHEKEGSFFAVKEIWSPVYIERKEITPAFNGQFNMENRYYFTNTNQCSFSWKLRRYPFTKEDGEINGTVNAPSIEPGNKGVLQIDLPKDWYSYDVMYITVKDKNNRELFTWSYPISRPEKKALQLVRTTGLQKASISEHDSIYNIHVKDLSLDINKNTGLLVEVKNGKGPLPLSNGPIIEEGTTNFKNITYRYDSLNLIVESAFDRKKSFNTIRWTIYPSGWIQLELHYFPQQLQVKMLGVNFDFPESKIKSVTYMGNGPYRVWKNRMQGTQFGVWDKQYNNTETGEQWLYPEFKGYYSGFYSGVFRSDKQQFIVATETEDLFLRLFTPAWKTDQWHNYEPFFPKGDISFMQAIPSIGNRTQTRESTGPMGMDNTFYDYEKDPSRALHMVLYFNFSGLKEDVK